jgi:hypothetical protein
MSTPLLVPNKHGLHYLGGFTLGVITCAILSFINVSIILFGLLVFAIYYLTEKYVYKNGELGCKEGKITVVNPFKPDEVIKNE